MCSSDQCGWYDGKRAIRSYKRPWIATTGQQTAAGAPLGPYGLIWLQRTPGEGDKRACHASMCQSS